MDIQIFNHEQFGQIRTMMLPDGQIGFVGKDVAAVLGYSKPLDALQRHVDEDDSVKHGLIDSLGRRQQTIFINESGLYSLILSSKLPKAREFKHWVTAVVLPQIRKTGGYINVDDNDDDDSIMAKALLIAQKTIAHKEALLEQQRPKVEYCDEVLMSEDCVTTTQVAKHFGLSAIALNNKLHELKIQFKQSGQWHLYARFAKMGLTKERTSPYYDSEGCIHTSVLTVWTERGKRFISELIRCGYDLDLALVKI